MVRDKVTRQCPQPTTFVERKNSRLSRRGIEPKPLLLTCLSDALPLGQTGNTRCSISGQTGSLKPRSVIVGGRLKWRWIPPSGRPSEREREMGVGGWRGTETVRRRGRLRWGGGGERLRLRERGDWDRGGGRQTGGGWVGGDCDTRWGRLIRRRGETQPWDGGRGTETDEVAGGLASQLMSYRTMRPRRLFWNFISFSLCPHSSKEDVLKIAENKSWLPYACCGLPFWLPLVLLQCFNHSIHTIT